jgi:hypothetical protein
MDSKSRFEGLKVGTAITSPRNQKFTVAGYAKTGNSVHVVVEKTNKKRTIRFDQITDKWNVGDVVAQPAATVETRVRDSKGHFIKATTPVAKAEVTVPGPNAA